MKSSGDLKVHTLLYVTGLVLKGYYMDCVLGLFDFTKSAIHVNSLCSYQVINISTFYSMWEAGGMFTRCSEENS